MLGDQEDGRDEGRTRARPQLLPAAHLPRFTAQGRTITLARGTLLRKPKPTLK